MSTYNRNIIYPVQLRMARAAIQITTRELGKLSGVSATTITRIENGQQKAQAGTMDALAAIFRERGLLFVAGDDLAGPGVRLVKG